MSSSSEERTFSPSDERNLRSRGEITPSNRPGMVRIRTRRLQNSSDETEPSDLSNLSLQSPKSPQSPITEPDENLEVPEQLVSVAALEFLGVNPEKSQRIYDAYQKAENKDQVNSDFHEYAKTWLEDYTMGRSYDSNPGDADYSTALYNIGASNELIRAIANNDKREYVQFRQTMSALEWLLQAIDWRWDHLLWAQAVSKHRAQLPPGQPDRSPIQVRSMYRIDSDAATKVAEYPTAPGETTIYKGTSRMKAEHMWANPLRTGGFSLNSIVSGSPSDFHPRHRLYYFTPQFEAAQIYAKYIKNIAHGSCIVAITIPNKVIAAQKLQYLWCPDDDWKKMIFYSRRSNMLKGKGLDKYTNASLLIGDTATDTAETYMKMKDWKEVGERNVLKIRNTTTKTIQWVFGEDLEYEIVQHGEKQTKLYHTQTKAEYEKGLSPTSFNK